MQSEFFSSLNQELKHIHKVLARVEGNSGCFNDVIVFRKPTDHARFNLVYFGGDVQDYEEEMKKSLTSRNYILWNLINTGNLLYKKFSAKSDTLSNVFVFRADYFHLRTFANYSNFVPSTDFGIPIDPKKPDEFAPKLDSKEDEDDEASLSTKPLSSTGVNKYRCWQHMSSLLKNSIQEYNRSLDDGHTPIDEALPIVVCSFSKGCVVLNQICKELEDVSSLSLGSPSDDFDTQGVIKFFSRIRHLIWLDGGHSGSSNSWIVDEAIIEAIKKLDLACYVYVTPYQMMSPKIWAIKEHETFVSLLDKLNVTSRKSYMFQDKEPNIELHFEIIKGFDSNLF